jgi:3-oxoacyl-[acyl-carrier protein] reductase
MTAAIVGSGPAVGVIEAAFGRHGLACRVVANADQIGDADVVVFAHLEPSSLHARPLTQTSDDEWDRAAEAPVRLAIQVAQAAYRRRARLIYVCPTVAIEGAAGYSALAGASEAIRALAKSAARRWGAEGITVNVVAPSLADLVPDAARTDAGRTAASLPLHDQDPLGEAVVWLAGRYAAGITGATVAADRGAVMAP